MYIIICLKKKHNKIYCQSVFSIKSHTIVFLDTLKFFLFLNKNRDKNSKQSQQVNLDCKKIQKYRGIN